MVIHLCDHVKDGVELQGLFNHTPMESVKGNTDKSNDYPAEKLLSLEDTTVFIAHGDLYSVEEGLEDIINQGICNRWSCKHCRCETNYSLDRIKEF